jgi:shikimate dehydrogenase
MHQYGIIGNPLGHSYSEQYFTQLLEQEGLRATYRPYAIEDIDLVRELLQKLTGFNVTYPYKEAIIPYLTEVDAIAKTIGAVNVVHRGCGYNTDWLGFRDSLGAMLQEQDQYALLLGTGGVSKAIQYALSEMGIGYTLVSRHLTAKNEKAIAYENVDQEVIKKHTIIVNCTPLGMHPYESELPKIPYEYLTESHLLFDCIYNPAKTLFLQEGEKHGCRIKNGLEMLHVQADRAWDIWKRDY